jgi:hypothetical protein
MIRKSLKYFLIAFTALVIMTLLLAIWSSDCLVQNFKQLTRPTEFLIGLGLTVLSLLCMFFTRKLARRIIISRNEFRNKIIFACMVTILVFGYKLVQYSYKIILYDFIHKVVRESACDKIQPYIYLANGTMAKNLTKKEYDEIRNAASFPEIPVSATNIDYSYAFDGFLPDYIFTLTYKVPVGETVELINITNGDFSKSQSFVIQGNSKIVTYTEGER